MLDIEITAGDGAPHLLEVPDEAIIGKGSDSDIRLDGWRLGKEHARLYRTPAGVVVQDLGAYIGLSVNGARVDSQYGPLAASDVITVGGYRLRVLNSMPEAPQVQAASPVSRSSSAPARNRQATEELESSRHLAARAAEAVQAALRQPALGAVVDAAPANGFALVPGVDVRRKELEFEWRKRIHAKLLDTMDLRRHDVSSMSDEQLRTESATVIRTIMRDHRWFGHYHTAGNPGRNDPDDSQELNYPAICRAIRDTGYQGWVAQEFIPRDPAPQAAAASLRDAVLTCDV